MRVIDVRSFDIPSDENDYDELVAFADTMACIPQFDAVPVEVLGKLRAEIEQLPTSKCTETHRIHIDADDFKENVLAILDKYKAEK